MSLSLPFFYILFNAVIVDFLFYLTFFIFCLCNILCGFLTVLLSQPFFSGSSSLSDTSFASVSIFGLVYGVNPSSSVSHSQTLR